MLCCRVIEDFLASADRRSVEVQRVRIPPPAYEVHWKTKELTGLTRSTLANAPTPPHAFHRMAASVECARSH